MQTIQEVERQRARCGDRLSDGPLPFAMGRERAAALGGIGLRENICVVAE